jgi:hypothetical protein
MILQCLFIIVCLYNLITIPYKPNLHSRQKLQNYNFTGQHRVPSEIFYNVAMVKTFSSLKILAILRWQTGLFNNFLFLIPSEKKSNWKK